MFKAITNITLAAIIAALIACDSPTSAARDKASLHHYVGNWSPLRVNYIESDSAQARHRLTLRIDSTFSCTFSLQALDLGDTAHLADPFVGKWTTRIWKGEWGSSNVGIVFIADSGRYGATWDHIAGSTSEGQMSFFNSDLGAFVKDVQWTLVP